MRNLYYVALGVLLLLQIPLNANGQNAVRTAAILAELNQQLRKPAPQDNDDSTVNRSRRFFQVLATGDASLHTVEQARKKYIYNPFLQSTVTYVFGRYEQAAKKVIENNGESYKMALDQSVVLAKQAQGNFIGFINSQLRIPKGDTVGLKNLQQLYKVAAGRDLPENLWADSSEVRRIEVRRILQDSIQRKFRGLFSGFEKQVGEAPKGAKPGQKIQEFAGTLRPQLKVYLKGQKKAAEQLDSLYKVIPIRYQTAFTLAVASKAGKENAVKQVESIDVSELPSSQLELSFNTAPGISLPTSSASLTRGTTAPTAGSAEGAIIDGAARFLADRLKQELNATFFQHFATLLHDSAYVELQVLFPSTARLLTSGSADYSTVVQTLRGTFERDLRELLFHYGTLLEQEGFYAGRLGVDERTVRVLHFTFASSRGLYYLTHGAHPADMLPRLRQDLVRTEILKVNSSLGQMLSLSEALSKALTDERTLSRQWLGARALDSLLRSPATRELMLGLLLEKVRQAQLPPAIQSLLEKPETFRPLAMDFVVLSGQLQDQAATLREKARKERLRANDFVPLYQTMQRSLEWAATTSLKPPFVTLVPQASELQTRLALYRNIGDALLQGYVAADTGDYGVTLSNLLDVVLLSLGEDKGPTANAKTPNLAARLTQSPQPASTQLLSLSQIVRYGSFMAAVAQAKSSDDVKEALEAAALPVGSASIKRRSFSSISVNAFVGVTTGAEYAFLTDGQRGAGLLNINSYRFNVGPTAPIGLAMSWGLRGTAQNIRLRALEKPSRLHAAQVRRLDQAYRYYDETGKEKFLRGSALGVFVSVLDLGVPVLLRFNDDKANTLPSNIGFRQVLAPGIFGMYHLRGMPLTLFAGMQYTPQLRELGQIIVESDTTGVPSRRFSDLDARNSIRYNVGLTIDIPLFQLYTRSGLRGRSPSRADVEKMARQDAEILEVRRQELAGPARQLAMRNMLEALPETQQLAAEIENVRQQLRKYYQTGAQSEFVKATGNGKFLPTMEALLTQAEAAARAKNWDELARLRIAMQDAEAEATANFNRHHTTLQAFKEKEERVRKANPADRPAPVFNLQLPPLAP
jgi:hypothetical protein